MLVLTRVSGPNVYIRFTHFVCSWEEKREKMFYVRNARGREPYGVEFLVQSRDQTRRTKIWEQVLIPGSNLNEMESVFKQERFYGVV